ncbi:hypothetical protein SETIT_2G244900v2 [Setaria italica]|uniref:Uncharacterized protein n=1 Tax=Setaria italica TaxID=4555 RepID=A0A368Q2W0_SETIT|nr:hypothetical protein SETIT_2G244900v2 [Setaria italica]
MAPCLQKKKGGKAALAGAFMKRTAQCTKLPGGEGGVLRGRRGCAGDRLCDGIEDHLVPALPNYPEEQQDGGVASWAGRQREALDHPEGLELGAGEEEVLHILWGIRTEGAHPHAKAAVPEQEVPGCASSSRSRLISLCNCFKLPLAH